MKWEMKGWKKCHKNLVHLPGDILSNSSVGSMSVLWPLKICFPTNYRWWGDSEWWCLCLILLWETISLVVWDVSVLHWPTSATFRLHTPNVHHQSFCIPTSSDICFHFHLLSFLYFYRTKISKNVHKHECKKWHENLSNNLNLRLN